MAENKEPSQRQLRVGQEIKRILAAFIQKGEIRNLEGIDTIVTITGVSGFEICIGLSDDPEQFPFAGSYRGITAGGQLSAQTDCRKNAASLYARTGI